jgi:hypothetical protein
MDDLAPDQGKGRSYILVSTISDTVQLTKQTHQPSSNCTVTKDFLSDLLNTHKWPCSRFYHAVPHSVTTEVNGDMIL